MNLHDLSTIEFSQPLWLFLMGQPLLVYLLAYYYRRYRTRWICENKLLPWLLVRPIKSTFDRTLKLKIIYFIAWMLLSIALAGPRVIREDFQENNRMGVDILAIVDASQSMMAREADKARIDIAKMKLLQLVGRLNGDRLGVVWVAGHAHMLPPLTYDKNALAYYISSVSDPITPTQGSRLENGLGLVIELVTASPQSKRSVIIFSDGNYQSSNGSIDAIKQAVGKLKSLGVNTNIVGVGTEEGSLIPATKGQWIKDRNGRPIHSRLESNLLEALADTGGGIFQRVTSDSSDIDTIYNRAIAPLSTYEFQEKYLAKIQWRELYHWMLFPSVLLFLYVLLYRGAAPLIRAPLLMIFSLSLLIGYTPKGIAKDTSESQAYQAFEDGNYLQCYEMYKRLEGYTARYNQSICAYRLENFDQAIVGFSQASLLANNDQEITQTLFNLANSYFNLGDYATAESIFNDVLVYSPGNQKALANAKFSKELRQAVEQEMELKINQNKNSKNVNRGGRGPNSKSVQNDQFDVGIGSYTFDDKESEHSKENRYYLSQVLNHNDLSQLIAKGLPFYQSNKASKSVSTDDLTFSVESVRQELEFINYHQQSNISDLWKRLFESEINIPAPLEEPQVIHGVDPW